MISDDNLARLGANLSDVAGLEVDGRYRVERRIARGGMGEILYATDLRLNRPVAMKVLAPDLSGEEFAKRFEIEAQTMSRIEHPGIVPVHDRGTFPDGRLYYTMKFVEGETLHELLARKPDRTVLLELFAKVCDVLQFAHERGVIHRDLKPTNVMIDGGGQAYVVDWGIAGLRGEASRLGRSAPAGRGLTSAGEILGTPEYMPPEQARGEMDRLDARADVYSLGAILYEILTGAPPARGTTLAEALAAAEAASPAPPRQVDPNVPRDLESICMKALAREPGNRYPSASALAEDVRRFLRAETISARPFPTPGRLWRKAVRYRVVVLLGAGLVLFAVFFGARTVRQALRVRSMLRTAEAHERAGQTELARDAYLRALQLDEGNRRAREGFDRLERELARRRDGERDALRLLANSDPALARAFKYLKEPEAERAELERLVREARTLLEEAVSKAPGLVLAHYNLGRCHELLGEDAAAEDRWRAAIRLDPGFGAVRYRLGRLLLAGDILAGLLTDAEEGHRRADVLRELEAALNAKFDDPVDQHSATGMIALLNRDWVSLRRIAFNGTELYKDKDGTEDLYWLGSLAMRGPDRLKALDRALQVCPQHVPARLTRGFEHLRRNDAAAAAADFDAALRIRPASAEAFAGRAASREMRGDRAGAAADYGKALEVAPPAWTARSEIERRLKRLQ